MFATQESWVKHQLKKYKTVSRNDALRRGITRLSAIIKDLRNAGWNLPERGEYLKTKNGRDFIYRLTK